MTVFFARRPAGRALGAALLALGVAAALPPAWATDLPPAAIETDHRDPWVPPQAVPATPPVAKSGAALRAQAEQKLRAGFDAADVSHTGKLTRDQARAAGLGFIVRHFDDIDTERAGAVSFDDVRRYLESSAQARMPRR